MATGIKFWDDMTKADSIELVDKLIIGKNDDGSTKYADVKDVAKATSATFEYVVSTNGILEV